MLKWTCDRDGNWRQVWVAVQIVNGRIVELHKVEVAGATATERRAA